MTRARIAALAAGAALAWSAGAEAGVPLWQRFLQWASPPSSETPVETHMMGTHMQMSTRQPERPGDAARAVAILAAARRVLDRYPTGEDAERAGYIAFGGRGVVGEEVHYTNYWVAGREARTLDLDRPGSILYQRHADGSMRGVGVMYGAKHDATPAELDARLPLSIAVWHRHVHFCGWPSGAPRDAWEGSRARFGPNGSIHTEAACAEAGGTWIPIVFGWMTHVYPFETERDKIWIGEQMMAAPAHARPQHRHESRQAGSR